MTLLAAVCQGGAWAQAPPEAAASPSCIVAVARLARRHLLALPH